MKAMLLLASLSTAALGGAALAGAALAGPGREVEFNGSFGSISTAGAGCDGVFAAKDYHVLHALAGPTLRTSIMKFTDLKDDTGFFDGVTFMGLLGGDDDLSYDKTLTKDGVSYAVHAEGTIDRTVVYLDFTVDATAADGHKLCSAAATYSGFN